MAGKAGSSDSPCLLQVKVLSTAFVAALVAIMVVISKKLPKHSNAWLTTCSGQQLPCSICMANANHLTRTMTSFLCTLSGAPCMSQPSRKSQTLKYSTDMCSRQPACQVDSPFQAAALSLTAPCHAPKGHPYTSTPPQSSTHCTPATAQAQQAPAFLTQLTAPTTQMPPAAALHSKPYTHFPHTPPAGLLEAPGALDLTSMTNIAVPTAYNLSFHLDPGLFAATDSQASPSFTGSAQISVLTATPTACFLLHAAGLEFSGIEISAGLGPGGKQVYDCACGAASHCKLRRCSDMVLPMQQCVPRAPSPCLRETCAGLIHGLSLGLGDSTRRLAGQVFWPGGSICVPASEGWSASLLCEENDRLLRWP